MPRGKKKTTHHRKPVHRRRSRVSGFGSAHTTAVLEKVAGLAIGAYGGTLIQKQLGAQMNPKMVAAAQIVIGGFLIPKVAHGTLAMGIADGLAAAGAVNALRSIGVMSGLDDVTYAMPIAGIDDSLSGTMESVLSGDDNDGMSGAGGDWTRISGGDDEMSGVESMISGNGEEGGTQEHHGRRYDYDWDNEPVGFEF